MATLPTEPIRTNLSDVVSGFPRRDETPVMHVRKRNGALEPVDVNKIVRAVQRCAHGLPHVDAMRIASKTIGGLYDGATTRELDVISIDTAAALIAEPGLRCASDASSLRRISTYLRTARPAPGCCS